MTKVNWMGRFQTRGFHNCESRRDLDQPREEAARAKSLEIIPPMGMCREMETPHLQARKNDCNVCTFLCCVCMCVTSGMVLLKWPIKTNCTTCLDKCFTLLNIVIEHYLHNNRYESII